MDPRRAAFLPSLDTVRLVLAPALVLIVTGLDRGYQTELWQHLARGRLIAQEASVVSVDRFTFTVPGREFRDGNWLSQLAGYGLYQAGGLELVQVANSLILAAAVGLLVLLCWRESGSTQIAGAAGVWAFLGLWQTLLIRPQSVSILLFVVLYAVLLAAVRRPRLLALCPFVMALWVNVHGGFAVGLALILTFAAPAAWRRFGRRERDPAPFYPWPACFVMCVGATLLNPYGWEVYLYAGGLSAVGVARGIEEWLPPSPRTLVGIIFALSVVGVGLLSVIGRRRLTVRDACVLSCFAIPAFLSVRMTVWWFLAAAPIAARLASGIKDPLLSGSPRPSRVAAGALAILAMACVASLPILESISPLPAATRSARRIEDDLAAIASALLSSPDAAPRLFTRMEWANYFAWRLDGRTPVFVEGHVELYPADVWSDYTTVNDGRPGWRDVLDRYRVSFLVIDPTGQRALLSEVRSSPEWTQRASSGGAVLFERRGHVPTDESASSDVAPAGGDF